jgi:hypothetical protein
MQKKEKELLACYRQLPPEDQVAVLSHVRTAHAAENSVKKIVTAILPVNSCPVEGDKQRIR